jgi:hypothetical protein
MRPGAEPRRLSSTSINRSASFRSGKGTFRCFPRAPIQPQILDNRRTEEVIADGNEIAARDVARGVFCLENDQAIAGISVVGHAHEDRPTSSLVQREA